MDDVCDINDGGVGDENGNDCGNDGEDGDDEDD